jgi:hypothetical protein
MGLSFTVPEPAATRAGVDGIGYENDVKSVSVWVFNGGEPDKFQNFANMDDFTATGNGANRTYTLDPEKQIIEVTAGARTVYIGVNLPADWATDAADWDETDLKAATLTLAEANTGTALAMIASKEMTVRALVEGADEKVNAADNKVSVVLERIVAKVVVTSANGKGQSFTQTFEDIEDLTITYTVDNWGIGKSNDKMFVVEGQEKNPATPAHVPFDATKFTNAIGTKASAQTSTTTAREYVGENYPTNDGQKTYAMVRSRASFNRLAKVNAKGDGIEWYAANLKESDFYVVLSKSKELYFCDDETRAKQIANVVDGVGYAYPGGYVYFPVMLNEEGKGKIVRNSFIHVDVTGIADNVFGGTPGAGEDGEEPIDPEDPNQINPIIPDKPATEQKAYLQVEVSVADWEYTEYPTDLE